jgi:predicted heme/steroid binding protein
VWLEGVVVIEGTNALTLHKIEGEWKVSSISDVSAAVEWREGEAQTLYDEGER